MTMTREIDLDALARRVGALERQNRHLRLLVVALATVACAVALLTRLAAGHAEDRAKSEEQEPVLKDKNGKQRARLTLIDGQPALVFYEANGTARGDVRLSEGGVSIRYLDGSRLRSGLGLGDEGVALVATDRNGKEVLGNLALLNGPGVLDSRPKKEKEREKR